MTTIELIDIGKRFHNNWIFRSINARFEVGKPTAITGANGSGKSTLLRIISAYNSPTEGKRIILGLDATPLHQQFALAAPYIDLIDDYTLNEQLHFHFSYQKCLVDDYLGLAASAYSFPSATPLRNFSSGMRQRVRLLLAVLSDTPVLLLDEPTSNLDEAGVAWYIGLIEQFTNQRLVIVASNDAREYPFCNQYINL